MKKILFQGDSITDAGRVQTNPAGSNGALGFGYPLLVQAKLGVDCPGEYEFVNHGISGNRIVDLYARVKRDMIHDAPDVLSILIGVNDVWHDLADIPNGVSAPKFERVYDLMLDEIVEALPHTRLLILEPFVLPGPATKNPDNPALWEFFSREVPLRAQAARRVAERHHAYFLPLQERFDEACRQAEPVYWLRDGVHPSPMGHELIAREWIKAFRQIG